MLYFAYGSNMSTPRLQSRVPSARLMIVARLEGYRLRFHKQSVDGSAKCDIEQSDDEHDVVHGVVFEIASMEKPALDYHEGLGWGYEDKRVSVLDSNDKQIHAVTYVATKIDPGLKPYSWYREHVLRGAREHGLPDDYIRHIAGIPAIPDPDPARHARELSIYQ